MSEVIIDMEDDNSGKFKKNIIVNSEEEYDFLKRIQEAYQIGKDKEWNFKKEKFHIAFIDHFEKLDSKGVVYIDRNEFIYTKHGKNVMFLSESNIIIRSTDENPKIKGFEKEDESNNS